MQLVATLSGSPSEDALRELALVKERLEQFGRNIEDVPLDRLQAELAAIEAEILEILVRDGVLSLNAGMNRGLDAESPAIDQTDAGGAETSESTSGEPTATPSAEPTPTTTVEPHPISIAGPTPTTSEEPSPSPTPSEEPTGEPTPVGSEEPTPAPTS